MLKVRFTIIIAALLLAGVWCRAQDTFDYAKIAPHPRLLLHEKEAANLKTTIKSSAELRSVHEYIIKECDGLLKKSPVAYEKKGPRLLAVSREALKRIFFLSYAYRMTGERTYLDRAEREMNTVCDFEDWNPRHFLDVGEMTMAVAIGYDWLYRDLKEATKAKVRKTVHNAFEASDNQWFLRANNNWNQVCNAGLVYGALAIFEDHPDESKRIIERAIKTNRLPMEAYGPDGNYPEGPGYWGYGSGFEAMMLAALESALGSDGGLSGMPGFLSSAEYTLFANGPIEMMFNYSDCGVKQIANIPIFWFAHKTNDPSLLYTELKWMREGSFLRKLSDSRRLLPIVLIFGQSMDFSKAEPPTKHVWSGRGINPVALVRTDWKSRDSEYLGIKGGTASASHGHMDAGTFVYDSKGLRWAMDFGMQSYYTLESKGVNRVDKSQDSERWGIFKYNNKNHNTLTINDKRHRVDGAAPLLETYDTKNEKGGKFDLSEIFTGEIKSAIRKAVIKDDAYLEVEDEIVTNDKAARVRWTMATPADVKIINGNTVELVQKGKKKILTVASKNPIELKTWESANPGTDYDAPNPGTIMIGFESTVPANTDTKFIVTIKDNGAYADKSIVKNDFLSGYRVGDDLEKGTYTSITEENAVFQEAWKAKADNSVAAFNTTTIAPLTYPGYVESGKDVAFEVKKLDAGEHVFGYSLTDGARYNYGTCYVTCMISVNDNLDAKHSDALRCMIGTGTRFTFQYDVRGVMLGATRGGAEKGKFRFGVSQRHKFSNVALSEESYNFNQTYLAVLKYDFTTQKASIFINPHMSKAEPKPTAEVLLTGNDGKANDQRGIRSIVLFQDAIKSQKIGGFRFAQTWNQAVGLE